MTAIEQPNEHRPEYFQADAFAQDQKVRYGDLIVTVKEHYTEGMWNVRLPGGEACVSGAELQRVYGRNDLTAAELLASIDGQVDAKVFSEPDDVEYFRASHVSDEKIMRRILVERAIVREAVQNTIERMHHEGRGYTISVFDGEDYPIRYSGDVDAIMAEIGACDEEHLVFRRTGVDGERPKVGSAFLVYGNDGWDVIADYSATPEIEKLLQPANKLGEELGDLLSAEYVIQQRGGPTP